MSSKTEVNCDLFLPANLNEILPTDNIFVGINGVHGHATTSFITLNESKAVSLDLASTTVTASGVRFGVLFI